MALRALIDDLSVAFDAFKTAITTQINTRASQTSVDALVSQRFPVPTRIETHYIDANEGETATLTVIGKGQVVTINNGIEICWLTLTLDNGATQEFKIDYDKKKQHEHLDYLKFSQSLKLELQASSGTGGKRDASIIVAYYD